VSFLLFVGWSRTTIEHAFCFGCSFFSARMAILAARAADLTLATPVVVRGGLLVDSRVALYSYGMGSPIVKWVRKKPGLAVPRLLS